MNIHFLKLISSVNSFILSYILSYILSFIFVSRNPIICLGITDGIFTIGLVIRNSCLISLS